MVRKLSDTERTATLLAAVIGMILIGTYFNSLRLGFLGILKVFLTE